MNTRALYWATKAIVGALATLAFVGLGISHRDGDDWISTALTFGLALAAWIASCRTLDFLDKLKREANRDTRLGLLGPATKEDLL